MLWYGIGILYDRYGSYDYAEEAFSQVMQIQPEFEKANEIYFRLGIIYKQQSKFSQSLEVCFSPLCLHNRFPLRSALTSQLVLQVHCRHTTWSLDSGRHLVPNRSRSRATKGL